jgi:hypothetical protein
MLVKRPRAPVFRNDAQELARSGGGPRDLAAQDRQLLPQHDDLELLRAGRSGRLLAVARRRAAQHAIPVQASAALPPRSIAIEIKSARSGSRRSASTAVPIDSVVPGWGKRVGRGGTTARLVKGWSSSSDEPRRPATKRIGRCPARSGHRRPIASGRKRLPPNRTQAMHALPAGLRRPVLESLHVAFVSGFDRILWVACAIAAAGALLSFLLVRQRDFTGSAEELADGHRLSDSADKQRQPAWTETVRSVDQSNGIAEAARVPAGSGRASAGEDRWSTLIRVLRRSFAAARLVAQRSVLRTVAVTR